MLQISATTCAIGNKLQLWGWCSTEKNEKSLCSRLVVGMIPCYLLFVSSTGMNVGIYSLYIRSSNVNLCCM